MKQLILLRHGEASFSGESDFQRQLTKKGRDAISRLGKTLEGKLKSVDLMYCSTATRTRETAELLGNHLAIEDTFFTKDIYDGDLKKLISLLENTTNTVTSCLLVGHNPTISLLLSHISGENYIGMQPGMMAILDLELSDWQMIGFGTGILKEILQ
ncbi:histidine phosphatase family protein [Algoriphagus sp.]|uniref:SixA phosphatase family protein n=1 Tax=Algoriphagus sp. TaxID=1872435 RepID=UPI00327D0EBF